MITLLLLDRATYIWVLFFAHIPFVVNRTFNATPVERLQQHPLLFTTNNTDCTFFLWRFHTAQPSHPGHSTILLRSESPSGMCAKLHTVAASNNRDHARQSLYYCLFVPRLCGCCSSRTFRSWWIAHSMQRQRSGCNRCNQNSAMFILKKYHIWKPHRLLLLKMKSDSGSTSCFSQIFDSGTGSEIKTQDPPGVDSESAATSDVSPYG